MYIINRMESMYVLRIESHLIQMSCKSKQKCLGSLNVITNIIIPIELRFSFMTFTNKSNSNSLIVSNTELVTIYLWFTGRKFCVKYPLRIHESTWFYCYARHGSHVMRPWRKFSGVWFLWRPTVIRVNLGRETWVNYCHQVEDSVNSNKVYNINFCNFYWYKLCIKRQGFP